MLELMRVTRWDFIFIVMAVPVAGGTEIGVADRAAARVLL
jgi:hypothetical protein